MTEKDLARQAFRRLKLEAEFEIPELSAYTVTGKENLRLLQNCGLLPHHKILEHGHTYLQNSWWLLRYLYDYRYFAVSPEGDHIDQAKETVLEGMSDRIGGIRVDKTCSFAWFNTEFNYFFSDGMWSTLGQDRVKTCLDSFLERSTASSTYLTAVKLTQAGGSLGDDVDLVNAEHNEKWLRTEAALRGLRYEKLDYEREDGLEWVLLQRQL